MRPPALRIHDKKIIVDLFAGGGGWSLAIEMALGRSPDIAVNHDEDAVAMHKVNHPNTEHFIEDIYDVDPLIVCRGREVGLVVLSPDCSEHSKAKNGAIVRNKKVRCLANVAHRWAQTVRPDVFILENVEEWEAWGPLDDEGKIDKDKRGEFFDQWCQRLIDMGYRLSWRTLRAHEYGTPTSRKRLFLIASCDPDINPDDVWPEATHGPGRPEPYKTAAECIDYSIPCPSIFMTREEARAYTLSTGIRCKRPLADKTMQRIRRGIYKYVLTTARPFLVPVTHGGSGRADHRVYDADAPMRTVTGANRGEIALVSPLIARTAHGDVGKNGSRRRGKGEHPATEPLPTVTCSRDYGLVAPLISPVKTWGGGGNDAAPADRPMRTITTSKRGEFGLVAPTLVQTGYGERPGQSPRCLDLQAPLGTIIAGGGGNGNGKHALVCAFLEKGFSERPTGGWNGGQPLTEPMGSVTCRDHHHLVTGHMVKLRGTSDAHMDASSSSYESPVPTISANGTHIGEVRAFLTTYHGAKGSDADGRGSELDIPLPTQDTSRRYGIVMIEGVEYAIVDIGFRMLKARELFRAQGFPDSYIINPIVPKRDAEGKVKRDKAGEIIYGPLDETAQIEKCGNSVPPPLGAAILRSVFAVREQRAAA